MAVVKCQNNHYYDDKKYQKCPFCNKDVSGQNNAQEVDTGENKTIAKNFHQNHSDYMPTQSLRSMVRNNAVDSAQKTVGLYAAGKNSNPIAGWLVCQEGENKGRSYEIHVGKNFVGRSMTNDIHINDKMVSREQHFTVVYEPLNIEFYVMQGNGITYYNGEILCDAESLKEGDIIRAGSSEYIFVPFCREGRNWNE